MKIGNLPDVGVRPELNKWYWGFEVRSCPPSMFRVFKPWFFVAFVKWQRLGEYGVIDGQEEIRTGGWRTFIFPWGISVTIY